MATKDLPQGIVGFNFAHALLSRDYDAAHTMLSAELKLEYPVPRLMQSFEEMMSIAEEPSDPPEIEVFWTTLVLDMHRSTLRAGRMSPFGRRRLRSPWHCSARTI